MIQFVKTDGNNADFILLVEKLDAYLKITDGEDHQFYNQYNSIDQLKYVLLAYENKSPVACGAIKKYDVETMEVKRMYVIPEARRKGLARKVLTHLEAWAKVLGFKKCILETGKRQVEAVQFYHNTGYALIPNYGQYKNVENSLCFQKAL